EQDLERDSQAAYEFVAARHLNKGPLFLYGQSLGSAAAVELASSRPCAALIIESGFTSASDMASVVVPWLPQCLHSIGRNRFESARKLRQIHCPILIVHGDPDQTIPTAQARELYASANEPKLLLLIPGADHNVSGFAGLQYIDRVSEFLKSSANASAQTSDSDQVTGAYLTG